MTKRTLLALILVASMLLSGCSLVMKDQAVDNKLTILEVDGEIVSKANFLSVYEYNVYMEEYYNSLMYSMFGTSSTVDTDAILETTLADYISAIVTTNKAAELGFDKFTAEEEAALAVEVQADYEDNLTMVKDLYFAGSELSAEELDTQVKQYAAANGLSLEQSQSTVRSSKISERLKASVTDLVTDVDDTALQTLLDSKIADEKTVYASSLGSFGASYNKGDLTYYTPAGYRTIRVIEVAKTEETAAAANEEITALRARIANGEAFDAISENIVTYVVCESSTDVDANVVAAAMLLDTVGAVSPIVETATGYAFAEYVGDIAESSAVLADVRDLIYDEALTNAKEAAYSDALLKWQNEADIKIYLENLSL